MRINQASKTCIYFLSCAAAACILIHHIQFKLVPHLKVQCVKFICWHNVVEMEHSLHKYVENNLKVIIAFLLA